MKLYFKFNHRRIAKDKLETIIGTDNLSIFIDGLIKKVQEEKTRYRDSKSVLTDVYHHMNYDNIRVTVRAKLLTDKELNEKLRSSY